MCDVCSCFAFADQQAVALKSQSGGSVLCSMTQDEDAAVARAVQESWLRLSFLFSFRATSDGVKEERDDERALNELMRW